MGTSTFIIFNLSDGLIFRMMVDKKQRVADEAATAAMARSGLGGHQRIEPEKVPEVVVWGDLLDLMIDHMSPSSLQADIKYLRYMQKAAL